MERQMDYGEVSAVYRKETEGKSLAELEEGFFENANKFIAELRAQAGEVQKGPQGANKSAMLLNDAKRLSSMLDRIKDSRERKIALLAQSSADPATLSLTEHERALFDGIARLLDSHRARLEGRSHADHEPCMVREAPAPSIVPAAGAIPLISPQEAAAPARRLLVVEVLEDIREFATDERTYALKRADVVALPRDYGMALLKSGKVKEIANAP